MRNKDKSNGEDIEKDIDWDPSSIFVNRSTAIKEKAYNRTCIF